MSDVENNFAAFTVLASWGNDGSAELSMRHDACGWWLDDDAIPDAMAPADHGHPFEGRAPLDRLVSEARRHLLDCWGEP